jgi:hypothetical protein
MALNTGSQTRIGYITESTAGTTPATPAFNIVPINDFSLLLAKDTFNDSTIQADRQNHYFKHGNKKVSGDVTVTLLGVGATPSGNTLFDPWFESVFNNAWNSNVLKIGNTQKSFTFEKTLTDIAGTSNYFRYRGCQATGVSIDVALNAPVKAKFTVAGLDADALATSIITGATYVSVPTAPQPFVHINASNFFKEGGVVTTLMTAFSLNIQNGSDTNYYLGSAVAGSITSSKASVTGSATFYFSDSTLYNKFVNETQSSLEVKLSDGTRSYTILLPAVVYSAATQVINNDNTVIVTMPFTAIFDATEATTVKITRA